jgi:hypothetical protein
MRTDWASPVESFSADRKFCIFDTGNTKLIIEAVASDAPAEIRIWSAASPGESRPRHDRLSFAPLWWAHSRIDQTNDHTKSHACVHAGKSLM